MHRPRRLIEKDHAKLNHLGRSMDPHAAFLLYRGMKTLALRVRHQNESALKIAQFLEGHPAVSHVNYPGLETYPRYQRARELFDGFGGVLSFELKDKDVEAADRFIKKTTLADRRPEPRRDRDLAYAARHDFALRHVPGRPPTARALGRPHTPVGRH